MAGYTCFHCKLTTADADEDGWNIMSNHECFNGVANVCVDDNNCLFVEAPIQDNAENDHNDENVNTENTHNTDEVAVGSDWRNEAVLLLLEKYEENKVQLERKNTMKKHIWKKIADEMNKQHYSFTWDQVQNKWKSLVRTYKNVKDNNNETGRNRKTWIFFDKMDQLFAKNPAIDPPVVMHNGQRILKSLDDAPESSSQLLPRTSAAHVSSDDDSGSTAKRQRKSSDLNDILIRAIEQNQKQHEEDLQEKRKFNSLLESLIQNIKK